LFDEYRALKEHYDATLMQLTKKDETLHNLQDCKHNLEEQVRQLQNVETLVENKIVVVQLPSSPISSSTITTSLVICEKNVEVVQLLFVMIVLFLLALKNTLHV
jgi:hypothetical protein